MKKLKKILYILKMIVFIIHFYWVFMMIDAIIHTGVLGYIFIFLYSCYNIILIFELLLKKSRNENDIVYNIMQIGYFLYIFILFYRIRISHIFVGNATIGYFNLNFGILCLLLVFIILYDIIELKNGE